jgi:hypothetical protein
MLLMLLPHVCHAPSVAAVAARWRARLLAEGHYSAQTKVDAAVLQYAGAEGRSQD